MRVTERRVLEGDPRRARGVRLRSGLAIGVGALLAGCSMIAGLNQLDGFVAADASVADVQTMPEAAAPEASDQDATPDASVDDGAVADASADTTTFDDAPGDAGSAEGDGGDAAAVTDATPDAPSDAEPDVLNAGACVSMWPEGGTNMIADPGFEEGGVGWMFLYGGTAAVTTSSPYCGSFAGVLTGRNMFFNALATSVTTTPGTYNVSAWVRHDGAAPLSMALGGVCTQASDGGPLFTSVVSGIVQPFDWTFLQGTITVPAGCQLMQFFVGQTSVSMTTYPDIFADDVYFGN